MITFPQRLRQCLTAAWHLTKETLRITRGIWHITSLPCPSITILGGSRLTPDDHYTLMAGELAKKLVLHNFSIITGGGPGIMEAANCGAAAAGGKQCVVTLGFSIYDMINEPLTNRCVSAEGKHLAMHYFYARKWLLLQYSVGFCIFPGGLGTFDELSELLNLMVTLKLPYAPIVLIGTEFWQPYSDWISLARSRGFIATDREPEVFIADTVDEAVNYIMKAKTHAQPAR